MPTLGFLNVGDKKYSLKNGESYVIGLASDAYTHDIEIDDASVDIKHCVLDFTEQIPKIYDIKSKCGTFVDQERIPSCCRVPLKKSTNLQIGKVDVFLQLAVEGDSGFLEDRLSPPVKEKDASAHQLQAEENPATNPLINTSKPDHEFLVPTTSARAFGRSIDSSKADESFDSFTIPETQMPPKDTLPEDDDDDDGFYIPETQDVGTVLSNYPRVAFQNEDVNETVADCDKIPSSQFRICTQDFNGSGDELSNNSDDILANVPNSLIIPVIRHSPVQVVDASRAQGNSEIEKELSAVQWSRTSLQIAQNVSTPDGVCTPDDLLVPNQAQIELPKSSSQCSTPDIFADHDVAVDEMEKSLKENCPPPAMIGSFKQSLHIHKPSAKKASSTPNGKTNHTKTSVVVESPLPPTQLFVPPPVKPKEAVIEKQNATIAIDDELPPTQVFQPVPSKPKTIPVNILMSSTLLDSGMHLSESSFKAKCNKLLDSDDDEMDEVVAPELVQKYRQSLENAKKSSPETPTDKFATPPQTNDLSVSRKESEKMLPPKAIPNQTPKDKPTASAEKKKSVKPDPKYVNIEDFLCTPDFLGKEFAKDEGLQKKAEQNWKNHRKMLFHMEETPTKPIQNESDDSQDSFIDLIPHKKKQEVGEQPEIKAQKEPTPQKPQQPTTVVDIRISRRRKSTVNEETAEKTKKHSRSKRTASSASEKAESAGDSNDKAHKVKKSKDSEEGRTSRSKKNSGRSTSEHNGISPEVHSDAKLAGDKVEVKQVVNPKTQNKSATSSNEKPSKQMSTRKDSKTTLDPSKKVKDSDETSKRKTRHKSATSSEGKLSRHVSTSEESKQSPDPPKKDNSKKLNDSEVSLDKSKEKKVSGNNQKWTETRILEVVLNKNGIRKTRSHTTKSSPKSDSDGLSKTRAKAKLVASSASPDDHTIDEKTLSSSENDTLNSRNPPDQEEIVKKRSQRATKQKTTDKLTKDEEEKPARRVTRQRSVKPTETIQSNEESPEPKQTSKSRQTRGRPKKTIQKDEPKKDTVDLTESDDEDRLNPRTTSGATKRKSDEEDNGNAKRTRPSIHGGIQQNSRKAKTKLKIAVTMCDPRYQEMLEKHSGVLWVYTKDPKECDVLILEKGNRTYKLMVAIARGIPIVKLDWLLEVVKRKSIHIPMEEYIFQDQQFQERHQFVMAKSLALAKSTSLLKGMCFLMTPNIRPSPSEMKDIITCAGGTVVEQVPNQKQRIFLVSQPNDNHYWHQYRRANSSLKIVTTEGVMASVMQQSESPLVKSIIQ